MAAPLLAFEDFELDVDGFELRHAGVPVPMEPQVFEILAYLVVNHGRIVLKDDLIAHVWPDGFITDSALSSRIMAARKAIGDTGDQQRLIRTIRGRGFRFIGTVTARGGLDDATGRATTAHSPRRSPEDQDRCLFSLDVAATTFVGRETELAHLEELLARPGCRLVTIAGPGGIGKTRLAAALADRLRAGGRDVASVSLQSVQERNDLHAAIAGALGLGLQDIGPAAIADALGARPVVLLLDNFEQLVAGGAATLATLVSQTGGLRIVVTSREVLGLREEWLVPVSGLALGDAPDSEALRLFFDREAQSGARDADGPGDDNAAAEICRLVDGMPLAIELAASLRRYLTRDEVAARIRRDIGVLRSDVRNLPGRHRTIPGLLEESTRYLDAHQASTLRALAVFEDSFTPDAATEVTGATLDALGTLVDRSLVQSRGGRFALHPLMRQFAREQLGPALSGLQQAHAEHFASFAASRREALEGGRQVDASREIDQEFGNVAAAWRFACAHDRLDLLESAGYPLYLYSHLRSRWRETRPLFELAIDTAERAGDEAWQTLAPLLIYYTWALIRTAPGPRVVALTARTDHMYREHHELPPPGLATDTVAIAGLIQWSAGRYPRLLDLAEDARTRAAGRADVLGEAYALWLAAAARDRMAAVRWESTPTGLGSYQPATPAAEALLREAKDLLGRASGLLERISDRWFCSQVLVETAMNAKALGDPHRAVALHRQVLDLRAEFDDAQGIANALIELAGSYVSIGDLDAATQSGRHAEPIVQRLGSPAERSELDRATAMILWQEKDFDASLERAARAVDLSLRIGAVHNVLGALRLIAEVLFETGDAAMAARIYALVAGHPASPPFARAQSFAGLEAAAAKLQRDELDRIREQMATVDLPEFARGIVARFGAGSSSV
ncbi:MAG: hypothetical protein Kow0010_07730 [Dehalococcoidia bacterium]